MSASTIPPSPHYLPEIAIADESRTSAAAVTSLILGILGFVPFITGLLAVVLGVMGLNATKSPLVKGRGMALAGLILGSLSLLCWGGATASVLGSLLMTSPEREVSRKFVTFMEHDNAEAALTYCTGEVSPDDVHASIADLRNHGKFSSITAFSTEHEERDGVGRATILLLIQYEDAKTIHYHVRLVKTGERWKVWGWGN